MSIALMANFTNLAYKLERAAKKAARLLEIAIIVCVTKSLARGFRSQFLGFPAPVDVLSAFS
jgi:hypothetical protein